MQSTGSTGINSPPKESSARYRRALTTSTQSTEHDEQVYEINEPSSNLIWTSISLVSGTAVGAGILAIASVSLKAGFIPSSITLVSAWGLMTTTGFLIAELTCNIARMDENAKNFGIIAITDRILGKYGSQSIGFFYVCFHYTLLIAYIAEAGGIFSRVTNIPGALGPLLFTTVMGSVIAFGSSRTVDILNSAFFVVVVLSFLGLVCLGIGSVQISNLGYQNYSAVGPTVPILLVALVFHNIIPTVCSNLMYHRRSIYIALVVGSSIPLAMFILWNAVILGMVHDYSAAAHRSSLIDPVEVLLDDNPTHSRVFGKILITIFSESAIITSFIGFVIGLMEFYGDIFPRKSKKDPCLYALVLIPPTLVALGNPNIFLQALDAAGTYGISVLFGLLPAVLTLRLRADAAKEVSTIFMTSVDNAVHQPLSTDSSHCAFEDNSSSSTLRTDTADRQPCHTTVSNKGTVQENLPGGTTVNRPFEGIEMSTIETAISQATVSTANCSITRATSSPLHGADSNDIESAHSLGSAPAYVTFVPGGDASIYFMMALFVGIIIDKLVTG